MFHTGGGSPEIILPQNAHPNIFRKVIYSVCFKLICFYNVFLPTYLLALISEVMISVGCAAAHTLLRGIISPPNKKILYETPGRKRKNQSKNQSINN